MPPKKNQALKGAKGKAKAADKEDKKVAKNAKQQPKGKYLGFESWLRWCELAIVRIIERFYEYTAISLTQLPSLKSLLDLNV